MKKNIFALLFSLLCISANAQKYDCFLDHNKDLILEYFNTLCNNDKKYTNSVKDSAGLLKVELSGYERISCEFHFDALGYCDRSQFVYACDACAEKHIQEFEQDKYYGWIKKGPGLYYSKRKRKMKMEVFNSNPAATVVIFTKSNWTKKEYKALTKKS